jgi:hypothetical protein
MVSQKVMKRVLAAVVVTKVVTAGVGYKVFPRHVVYGVCQCKIGTARINAME